jgi:hypothetical protein
MSPDNSIGGLKVSHALGMDSFLHAHDIRMHVIYAVVIARGVAARAMASFGSLL